VAGDAGQEAVLAEQRLQVRGALGDPLGRHADVLDDQRRARPAQPPDQPVQALAHPPGELDLLGVAGEAIGRIVSWREDLARAGDVASSSLVGLGPELDQQHRRLGRQLLPLLRRPDHVPGGGDQRRRDHQLDRGGAGRDRSRTGAIASSMPGSGSRRGRAGGSGTVSKTASATKPSVPSEPIRRRRNISSGSSASRKAQSR
jgi:hypothetical protein